MVAMKPNLMQCNAKQLSDDSELRINSSSTRSLEIRMVYKKRSGGWDLKDYCTQ